MKKKKDHQPTGAELAILNVLWERGSSTVREVHEAMPAGTRRGYTTTLKQMQIMAEKGLVHRDESQRSHVYSALRSREETQGWLVGDLARKAFDGSATQLILRALSQQPTSSEELREIREILDRMEKKSRRRSS